MSAISLRVSKLIVVELKKKNGFLPASTEGLMSIFYPRLIFDPVMKGQRSNFCEYGNHSNVQFHISKTFHRSEMKLSPACFSFNSV